MNLNIQFQMQDIIKKSEAAQKKKSSANLCIIFGSILLFIGICLVALSLISSMGAQTQGTLSDISGMLGCCISIAGLLGIVGIVLLVVGIVRRSSANQELKSIEEETKLLRTQMIAEEHKKNSV